MIRVRIPGRLLATGVRDGRITVGGVANIGRVGFVLKAAGAVAAAGLNKAAASATAKQELQFPSCCCNCLAERGVRPVESFSTVNRGVAYTFGFRIPHCSVCADTANRKRPGLMGMLAAFLGVSVPVGIAMLGVGAATNRDGLITASLVAAPLAGLALPYLWVKARRPRAGQASRYQAVYASGIDIDFSGTPNGFTLAFENPTYARRFVDLNRDRGVAHR